MAKKEENKKKETPHYRIITGLGVIILVIILISIFLPGFVSSPQQISWLQFEKEIISRKAVDRIVVVNKEQARVYIKIEFSEDSVFRKVFYSPIGINPGPHYTFNIGSVETFERKMEEAQKDFQVYEKVNITYEERSNFLNILSWLIPLIFFFFIIRMFMQTRSGGKGPSAFSFGKSTARLLENDGKSTVTFNQVAGLDEAKMEVKEIVDFLKHPSHYTRLGAKIPKGVIIVGPPGTGKTLLAKAVAGEAQVPFFTISGAEFVEMFVGVGASRVRDLFRRAKEKAPCIVFIDEIDAVGRSRGRNAYYTGGANDERESTLDQLLSEMDGFGTNTGVIVLAATNRADILDPALLRPGRFDRHIYLELPNLSERKEIFNVHLKPLKLEDGIDVSFLASQTPGFSGADIANICNEAALIAARQKKKRVGKEDFLNALDRVVAGLEKKSKIISAEEKQIIAYHEAGHAIVSWLLEYIDPLMKVSIIPRGKSLGAAWYLPEEHQIMSYSHFRQRLTATLAGRAAEDIIFSEVSSGGMDDLEKVTKEAYTMVAYFGFNKKIGNISFYDSTGRSEIGFQKPYSEETARIIDEEVRKLVEECYMEAKNILFRHKKELDKIAELLLKKEVIYKEELEKILGKRTPPKTVTMAVNS